MSALPYTGERAVPWNGGVGAQVMSAHVARYAWAFPYAYGKRVVDLGCGAGYGSFMLSWGAAEVLGVDISGEAVSYACETFRAANLDFVTADITKEIPPAELYVCFECLEHLPYPTELLSRLKAPLIWSMPVDDGSRYHARPYSVADIKSLMGEDVYYQGKDGQIAHRGMAWFLPKHVMGVYQP